MENETKETQTLNYFDRMVGLLHDLPDVVATKPTTLQVIPTFGLGSHTYVVRRFRQREVGDTVFLQDIAEGTTVRIVIPPKIANVIARQRDQLNAKSRSKASRQAMADRMARGEKPGFMKGAKA